MRFEWDERKNQSNIRKHGVAFDEAIEIFENEPLQYFDVDNSWDEDRYVAIGFAGMKILSVVLFIEATARFASSRHGRRLQQRRGDMNEGIDFSDIPELGEDFFSNAVRTAPLVQKSTLLVDSDVSEWFRANYTPAERSRLVSEILRRYMAEQQAKSAAGDASLG